MGGGLMQLVAYGAQDIYLTGNPQITFFKVVYRRHTNFSMECIEQTWNGTSVGSSGAAGRCTATISRNGDLVNKMHLQVNIVGGTTTTVANPMACVITNVTCDIGGQQIDKQSGQWMNIWSHLTQPNPGVKTGGLTADETTVGTTNFQRMTGMAGFKSANFDARYFIPLQFWFCRNPGLALPLIALQYHEVKIILDHKFSLADNAAGTLTNQLWVDYIYLDTDERRRFAQVSHEYLIEQIQEGTVTAAQSSDLNFNHPVKELIWCVDAQETGVLGEVGTLASADGAQGTYGLKLNGHDRFAARDYRYFTRLQVEDYHTGPGGIAASLVVDDNSAVVDLSDGIGVYSFALKPEEHQPSGTCNFSRIDNAQFVQTTGCKATKVYAVNYNVLRIMSGMGGLAYSN
jgi:hypothetical protein